MNTNYKLYRDDECVNMNPIENLRDLIIYQSQNNENIFVEVLYDNEDFWLTQKSMAKLFKVGVNTINYKENQIDKKNENPSVGVILCASKDEQVVEYAMSRSMSHTMVSQYTLNLIDKKLLEEKLKEIKDIVEENNNKKQT